MRTSSEEWISKIKGLIEQGYDPYLTAMHIYADIVMQAVAEKQNEIDTLILLKRVGDPDS
jgi:hypothetical protein